MFTDACAMALQVGCVRKGMCLLLAQTLNAGYDALL